MTTKRRYQRRSSQESPKETAWLAYGNRVWEGGRVSAPTVSVILPTRDRRVYLEEAIASIVVQSLPNFELIVVDDASTDGSGDLLAELARSDERIRVVRTPENVGCNTARNMGLDRVRGRYVAFLDDDDLALPDRLATTVARLHADPELDVVTARIRFIDAEGRDSARLPPPCPVDEWVTPGDVVFERLYCDWAWLPTSSLTSRAALFARHRFPGIRRSDGDSILFSQMAATGARFAATRETLALVRRDPGYAYMSHDRERLLAARRESLAYLRRWLREEGIPRFDHLHDRAWSNHLMKEASHLGGLRGLTLTARVLLREPQNASAHRYLRQRARAARERLGRSPRTRRV